MARLRDTAAVSRPLFAVLFAVVAAALTAAAPSTATAGTAAEPIACHDGHGVEGRQPVLLVHGFNSAAAAWSDETRQYLGSGRDTCIVAFDYAPHSTRWVTDPALGPALARTIDQLAAASVAGRGPGNVILVGHSMGGLAARCAADPGCSGVPDAGRRIRVVITLGTPHLGTYWKGYGASLAAPLAGAAIAARCRVADPLARLASGVCGNARALLTSDAARAFTPGSGRLRALPSFPEGLPVLAIAASTRLSTSLFGRVALRIGDAGDLVVAEDSALAEWNQVRGIGGEKVIDCGTFDMAGVTMHGPSCWHGSMTNDVRFRTEILTRITEITDVDGTARRLDPGRSETPADFAFTPTFVPLAPTVRGRIGSPEGADAEAELTPALHGFELVLDVSIRVNDAFRRAFSDPTEPFRNSCLAVDGRIQQRPLAQTLTASGGHVSGTITYPAVLNGVYLFDYTCHSTRIELGVVSSDALGTAHGASLDNGLTVYARRDTGTSTVLLTGSSGRLDRQERPEDVGEVACATSGRTPTEGTPQRAAQRHEFLTEHSDIDDRPVWYSLQELTFSPPLAPDARLYYRCVDAAGFVALGG